MRPKGWAKWCTRRLGFFLGTTKMPMGTHLGRKHQLFNVYPKESTVLSRFLTRDWDILPIRHTCLYPFYKPLKRPVYLRAHAGIELLEDTILLVVKPIYGIPESGLHWYITYLEYHIECLGMMNTTAGPCLLVKSTDGHTTGLVAPQLDGSLSVVTEQFMDEE